MGLIEDTTDEQNLAQGALREAALAQGDGLAELQPLLDDKFRAAKEDQKSNQGERQRLLLQHAARQLGQQLLDEAAEAKAPPMAYVPADAAGGPVLPRLLDLTVQLLQQGYLDQVALGSLLEDIVACSVVEDLPDIMVWMETSLAPLLASRLVKDLPVLRLGNSLLRRLSKVTDCDTMSRMLLFYARMFPIQERSGVNVTMGTNTDYPYAVPEELEPPVVDCEGQEVDVGLYKTFWGLQETLRNYRVLSNRQAWAAFRADLTTVLKAFDNIPIKVPAGSQVASSGTRGSGGGSMDVDRQPSAAAAAAAGGGQAPNGHLGHGAGVGGAAESAVVTYLSSHTLFNLQMRDGLFRRGFLVQALICLHSANTLTATTLPFVRQDVTDLMNAVVRRLREVGANGLAFARACNAQIQEEAAWHTWKANKAWPGYYLTAEEALAKGNFSKLRQLFPGIADTFDQTKTVKVPPAAKGQWDKAQQGVCDWTRTSDAKFSIADEVERLSGRKRRQREEEEAVVQQVAQARRAQQELMLRYDFDEPISKDVTAIIDTVKNPCSSTAHIHGSEAVFWLQELEQQRQQQQQQAQQQPDGQQQLRRRTSQASDQQQQQQQQAPPDSMAGLAVEERAGWPTLQALGAKALSDMDPEGGVEQDERRLLTSAVYRWQLAHMSAPNLSGSSNRRVYRLMLRRPPLEDLLQPGDPEDPSEIPDEEIVARRLAALRTQQSKIKGNELPLLDPVSIQAVLVELLGEEALQTDYPGLWSALQEERAEDKRAEEADKAARAARAAEAAQRAAHQAAEKLAQAAAAAAAAAVQEASAAGDAAEGAAVGAEAAVAGDADVQALEKEEGEEVEAATLAAAAAHTEADPGAEAEVAAAAAAEGDEGDESAQQQPDVADDEALLAGLGEDEEEQAGGTPAPAAAEEGGPMQE